MKKIICLLLLLGFLVLGVAQEKSNVSPLQAMVATEFAFAKMSEQQGVRPSFMAFIADDGILFRPKAVKGKQWMTDHPVPPSDKRPLLKWYPSFADMARAGDMGYTFGPWEFKNDVSDAQPVGFGHFLTVWKKQNDGTWKFAVDLGISHPQPTQASLPWDSPKNYKQPPPGRAINVESDRAALLALERKFSNSGSTSGAQVAFFVSNAAEDVRVFREGKLPFVGRTTSMEVLSSELGAWSWQTEFADVSRSGDLGYTYGTYRLKSKPHAKEENGNCLRIWKKQARKWKVVADLANPIPEN